MKRLILASLVLISLFVTPNIIYAEGADYYDQAKEYITAGKYKEAINSLNKAIEKDPKSSKAYYVRGIAYDKVGKYKEAVRDFNKAIEIDPKNAYAYAGRGIFYGKVLGE